MTDEWMARWTEVGATWRLCTAAVADAEAVLEEAKKALAAARESERLAHRAVLEMLQSPAASGAGGPT